MRLLHKKFSVDAEILAAQKNRSKFPTDFCNINDILLSFCNDLFVLQSVVTHVAGANSDDVFDVEQEDFAVAHIARV